MRVPDEVRKCIVFLGHSTIDGQKYVAGTAFFLSTPTDSMEGQFSYLVTARHVIDGIISKGCAEVWIRANFKDGHAEWIPSDTKDWSFHPEGETVDVAVTMINAKPISAGGPLDVRSVHINMAVTKDVPVGLGDELFLTGHFAPHYGKGKNIPIVRVGNIAAMPEERVSPEFGRIEAYLIECRSIGGLSGSPVFVIPQGRQFHLLGLMQEHWDSSSLIADIEVSTGKKETVNLGIGVVVPAEKIIQVVRQEKFTLLEDAAMPSREK
jgi:hypothetical protein